MLGGNQDSFESIVNSLTPRPHTQNRAYTTTQIGTTEYQNQTNASICNRVIKHNDGTISATWTMAIDPAFADRGTGYNYFDGANWAASPTVKIEGVRTGFTNIGVTSTGGEVIVAHEASNIHVSTRPAKGTGAPRLSDRVTREVVGVY